MQKHIICHSWPANVTRHFCQLWELRMTKLSIFEEQSQSRLWLETTLSKEELMSYFCEKMVSALIKFSNFESKI